MTLGEIINVLKRKDPDAYVFFDFCQFKPTRFESWRGNYAELAINYGNINFMTVKAFLQMCEECVGKEFFGYKGGNFIMHENSRVWVANNGESGYTYIKDIIDFNDMVILSTGVRNV